MGTDAKVLQPIRLSIQGGTPRLNRETCVLQGEDCKSRDKEAVQKYIDPKKKDIVLNEQQRAEEASGLSNRCLQWRIETTESLLNQVEDLELSETAEEVKTCLDVYTKERDKRKEAGTWKQPRKW